MKKYLYLFFIAVLLVGCDIDLKPESSLTYNGFWDTEEAVRANHTGIYARLRGYNSTLWGMGELRSDIWGGKTQESAWGVDLTDNNISTTSVPYGNWANFYGMIHYLNDFLKNAPGVEMADTNAKNQMLAQVYGIRAYVYYTMLKTWGKVPITTEPLQDVSNIETLKKARSPRSEVLNLIKSDIQKSLDLFGSDNSKWLGKSVYWSKAATLALKGDVYIWSGKVEGGGSADFQEAKKALQSISGYSLTNTFADLWSPANENNDEFIFAFDYEIDQSQSFYNGPFTGQTRNIWPTFDSHGVSLNGFNSSGQNRYGPSEKLIRFMQLDPNDPRMDETFILMYKDNAGYPVYDDAKYSGAILKKFLGDIIDGSRTSYANVPIYRYADVILLLAEAKNNLGEDPSTEINKIRKRAYGSNYSTSVEYTNGSQDQNTKAILDERLKEFIGEGKRWWDLLRAGGDYVFDEVPTLNASDRHLLYLPLTQDMLNNDEMLEQTEGY